MESNDNKQRQLVIRSTEDILAVVPVILGFRPADSVVMLCSHQGPTRAPHARIDLGRTLPEQQAIAEGLADVARRSGISRVVLLFYSDDVRLAERNARQCLAALKPEVEVVEALRVTDTRYYPLRALDPALAKRESRGRPYDNSSHPFTTQAVVEGEVIHQNREALRALVNHTNPAEARAVRKAVIRSREEWGSGDAGTCGRARWLQDRLSRYQHDRERLDVDDAAKVLALISEIPVRDVAWLAASDGDQQAWVALWTDLTQRSSKLRRTDRTAPAALLAFCAWQAGDGALAWCAVDKCLDADPDYSMAHLVAQALSLAMDPTLWQAPSEAALVVFQDPRYADAPKASAS